MSKTQSEQNISSAEITAYMRSQQPELSRDNVSYHLVSDAGFEKFYEFVEGMQYPLATRKIFIRAGYFYQQALRLLQTGQYDSCISIASGFSMLTYQLARVVSTEIQFYDTDLPHMLALRQARIEQNQTHFDMEILQRMTHQSLDATALEEQSLKSLFPNCKRPLFIIEGLLYFLEPTAVTRLLNEITSYEKSAVLLDYWPENGLAISAILKRIICQLKGFIAEDIQCFLTSKQLQLLHERYKKISDISILEADTLLSEQHNQLPELLDQNEVFPIRILVAE